MSDADISSQPSTPRAPTTPLAGGMARGEASDKPSSLTLENIKKRESLMVFGEEEELKLEMEKKQKLLDEKMLKERLSNINLEMPVEQEEVKTNEKKTKV